MQPSSLSSATACSHGRAPGRFPGALLAAAFLLAVVLLAGTPGAARATTFSYAGTFFRSDSKILIPFSVDVFSLVTVQTFGYGGGVNGTGAATAGGGFDPLLRLFNSDLIEIAQYDDALQAFVDAGIVRIDPATGEALDAYGEIQLDGGSYFLGLEVAPQFPFNPDEDPLDFTDGTGSARSGAWALDITVNRDGAFVIPEPGTVSLIVCGALPLLLAARRRRGPRTPA